MYTFPSFPGGPAGRFTRRSAVHGHDDHTRSELFRRRRIAPLARDRNYAIITFMETFYVTWFMYGWNLLVFDPAFAVLTITIYRAPKKSSEIGEWR